MAGTPEGKVKQAIKAWLDRHGFWRAGTARPPEVEGWYYMPVSNGFGVHGIPDFDCIYHGRSLRIEAKAPGGTLSGPQTDRHSEIAAAGGIVLTIADVSRLDDTLLEVLRRIRSEDG